MNTPVTITLEGDSEKSGAIYVGRLDDGKVQLAVEDRDSIDEANVYMSPEHARQVGMKLIVAAGLDDE